MSIGNVFNEFLQKVYNKFHNDTAKMLIYTSVAGYILSSLAQIAGMACSSKFSNEQKSYLLPQEAGDALINILTFLVITTGTKKTVAKLFETGKWGPKNVKAFLKNSSNLTKDIGKLDFKVTDYITDSELIKDYNACKDLNTTIATIGAGILSSSIITPLVRNKMASTRQKQYIEMTKELNANNINKPKQQDALHKPNYYTYTQNYSSDLKI